LHFKILSAHISAAASENGQSTGVRTSIVWAENIAGDFQVRGRSASYPAATFFMHVYFLISLWNYSSDWWINWL